MKNTLLALLCLAAPLCGQTSLLNYYTASKQTALTSSSEVVTIQQPATAAKKVYMDSVYIGCSVACTVTLERDGSGATSTALTPVPGRSSSPAAVAKAWHTSNVGVGTVIGQYDLPAGSPFVIDLTGMALLVQGINNNVTVRTSTITGNVKIVFKYSEQ